MALGMLYIAGAIAVSLFPHNGVAPNYNSAFITIPIFFGLVFAAAGIAMFTHHPLPFFFVSRFLSLVGLLSMVRQASASSWRLSADVTASFARSI